MFAEIDGEIVELEDHRVNVPDPCQEIENFSPDNDHEFKSLNFTFTSEGLIIDFYDEEGKIIGTKSQMFNELCEELDTNK